MTVHCTDTALLLQFSEPGDFIYVLDSWSSWTLAELGCTRWLCELSCSHSLYETQYFFVSVLPLLWNTCFAK